MRDFAGNPAWRDSEVGTAIPDSEHAVSVALPTWKAVVGYEEHDPLVWEHVRSGYPRFVVHPLVAELAGRMARGRPCLPFPSRAAAEACAAFLRDRRALPAEVIQKHEIWGVVTSTAGIPALRTFWQHTGLGLSSRQAAAVLEEESAQTAEAEGARALCGRLAGLYDCAPEDVLLHPSGMASLYTAFRAVTALRPEMATLQFGFPYVDTLKLQQAFGSGVVFHPDVSSASLHDLDADLAKQSFAACFCEIPGNPMLGCPDLDLLSSRLRKHGIPLVVDDTVATPFNVDLGGHADLIATSLTKFISGSGDVMGGALICNPRSPHYAQLKNQLQATDFGTLWWEDAARVAELAADFADRMPRHNRGGEVLAARLREHPAIERVWYPKWEDAEAYEKLRRPGAGWGGLISLLPRHAAEWAPRIYDALPICKGPSLGTLYSLACPFTLLAHYNELDWAESCGVSANMIRISVGLEEPDALWERLRPAFDGVCKSDAGEV